MKEFISLGVQYFLAPVMVALTLFFFSNRKEYRNKKDEERQQLDYFYLALEKVIPKIEKNIEFQSQLNGFKEEMKLIKDHNEYPDDMEGLSKDQYFNFLEGQINDGFYSSIEKNEEIRSLWKEVNKLPIDKVTRKMHGKCVVIKNLDDNPVELCEKVEEIKDVSSLIKI